MANTFANVLAVILFPTEKLKDIFQLMMQEMSFNRVDGSIMNQAFWTVKCLSESGPLTLFCFVGEFKHALSDTKGVEVGVAGVVAAKVVELVRTTDKTEVMAVNMAGMKGTWLM